MIAGGAIAGTLLLGTAGLALAPGPDAGPSEMGPGMMGGQTGAGMMGAGPGMMGAGMMGVEQLAQVEALHDQMVASGSAMRRRCSRSTLSIIPATDPNRVTRRRLECPAGASTCHLSVSDTQRPLTRLSGEAVTVAAMKPRTLALLVLAGALLLSGCAAATPSSAAAPSVTAALSSPTVRTSDGGQVSVAVDWRGPAAGAVFDVTLDTHTVDLDALDLADAVLRNDRGEWMSALPWAAPLGGHHRAGPLTFAGDAAPFFNGAMWIELVVSGVGDIPERTLRWEIAT